jgi:hypothetical protein
MLLSAGPYLNDQPLGGGVTPGALSITSLVAHVSESGEDVSRTLWVGAHAAPEEAAPSGVRRTTGEGSAARAGMNSRPPVAVAAGLRLPVRHTSGGVWQVGVDVHLRTADPRAMVGRTEERVMSQICCLLNL